MCLFGYDTFAHKLPQRELKAVTADSVKETTQTENKTKFASVKLLKRNNIFIIIKIYLLC